MALLQRLRGMILGLYCVSLLQAIPPLIKSLLRKVYTTIFGEAVSATPPPAGVLFRDGWLVINGVPTHVVTWGGWVEDPLPDGESLLIFMCGVPGVTHFYQHFLELLHIQSGIPVWTISIAGHEIPPPSSIFKLPKDSSTFNNVKAQIAHKMAFYKQYVPRNTKIYFIGHSFGSKMVLELLKDDEVQKQTEKTVLLMPTIERFRETPRAQFWLVLVKTGFVHILILCTWILYLMPMSWQRQLALLYFRSRGLYNTHECLLDAMVQFWEPTVFYNARMLAWDELDAITKLDTELLMSQKEKMKVFFAPNDYWAPLSHCESLKTAVPGLPVEVLDKKFIHSFTLSTAQDMVDILVRELKGKEDKNRY